MSIQTVFWANNRQTQCPDNGFCYDHHEAKSWDACDSERPLPYNGAERPGVERNKPRDNKKPRVNNAFLTVHNNAPHSSSHFAIQEQNSAFLALKVTVFNRKQELCSLMKTSRRLGFQDEMSHRNGSEIRHFQRNKTSLTMLTAWSRGGHFEFLT